MTAATLSATERIFDSKMSTIWSAIDSLSELAEQLEELETLTPAALSFAETLAAKLRQAYTGVKEEADFTALTEAA